MEYFAMVDPFISLLIGIGVLLLGAIIAWPRVGLLSKLNILRQQSSRVLVEDALKHLYHFEYKSIPSTLESLAGALSIPSDTAVKLISKLEAMELLIRHGVELELSSEGRSYALRIIRIHRLWERYLADQTTVHEAEWHARAEQQEHVISIDEANALATRLGHPAYDPHGDPIPSPSGILPRPQGKSLTSLKKGEIAGIVHVEDEPTAIYEQLVAQGLYPGMNIHMIDQSTERVVFVADGNEIVLAPVIAANVTVVPLAKGSTKEESFTTLAQLYVGESGVVTGLSSACRGLQRRRLMDLGVVPGTRIKAELQSPLGDPSAYTIRGSSIALRKEHAELIYVDKLKKEKS
jgi:DtxR family transcriptional regulator, Mn-dependent transcriptional regulator